MALCAPCFERLADAGDLASMRTVFRDYTRMAGAGALLGIVFIVVGAVIGPVVVYWALRGLRQKSAMGEGEGRVGAVLSLVVGLLETAAGVWILLAIFHP